MASKTDWEYYSVKTPGKMGYQDVYTGCHIALRELQEQYPQQADPIPPEDPILLEDQELRLQHDTDLKSLEKILQEGFKGFKGSKREPNPDSPPLSWWALKLPNNVLETLINYFEVVMPADTEEKERSPLLKQESRYGNYRISLRLQDIVKEYKDCMECQEVEYRIYRTHVYTREVMYSVVVLPKQTSEDSISQELQELQELPMVPHREGMSEDLICQEIQELSMTRLSTDDHDDHDDHDDQVLAPLSTFSGYTGEKMWEWNLSSVSMYDIRRHPKGKTYWDHITFTFYLPEDKYIRIPSEMIFANLEVVPPSHVWLGNSDKYDVETAAEQLKMFLQEFKTEKDKLIQRLQYHLSSTLSNANLTSGASPLQTIGATNHVGVGCAWNQEPQQPMGTDMVLQAQLMMSQQQQMMGGVQIVGGANPWVSGTMTGMQPMGMTGLGHTYSQNPGQPIGTAMGCQAQPMMSLVTPQKPMMGGFPIVGGANPVVSGTMTGWQVMGQAVQQIGMTGHMFN